MALTIYPTSIEEFSHNDAYEIKYPLSIGWKESVFRYNKNMCDTRRANLEYLIKHKRIRIIK